MIKEIPKPIIHQITYIVPIVICGGNNKRLLIEVIEDASIGTEVEQKAK